MKSKRIVFAIGLGLLPILMVAYFSITMGIETQTMTRDIAAIAKLHPLAGFLSNFGMIVWCISASILFFTAYLLKEHLPIVDFNFLKYFGLLTTYLGLDDFFQIHESIAPGFLGIPEKLVLLSIILAAAFVFLKFRKQIIADSLEMFLIAICLLGGSVIYDVFNAFGHWDFLIEDGMKWLGICFWCYFCYLRCKQYWQAVINKVYFSPR